MSPIKWAIRRGRRTFTIDMLAAREQLNAGTLSAVDRALIERVLPGALPPPPDDRPECPRCGPISVALSKHTCPYAGHKGKIGPKGNDCGTENAGKNAAAKPLKGRLPE
jgi:hypothetical protein